MLAASRPGLYRWRRKPAGGETRTTPLRHLVFREAFAFARSFTTSVGYLEHLLGALHFVEAALNLHAHLFFQPLHVLLGLRQLRFALAHYRAALPEVEDVVS